MSANHSIEDIREIEYCQKIPDAESGDLYNIEYGKFESKRSFTIVNAMGIRGNHAHISMNQLLICVEGSCMVTCEDENNTHVVMLKTGRAIYIPSGIWATQKYLKPSMMIVLCDQYYDENDYIRNWDKFVIWKNNEWYF